MLLTSTQPSKYFIFCLFISAVVLRAIPGRSQTVWSNSGSGTWNTPGNWSPATVPGAATVAQFNANPVSGSAVSLNASTNPAAVYVSSSRTSNLIISNSALGSSTLTLSGGTVNSIANTVIANFAGSNATLTFQPGLLAMPVAIGAGKFIQAGAGTSLTSGNTINITSMLSGSNTTFLGGGSWDGMTGANGGVLKLGGANPSFSGTITVGSSTSSYNSGVLELNVLGAIPAAASLVINPFSQLYLNSSAGAYNAAAISVSGIGNNAASYGRGAIRSGSAAATLPGTITMTGNTVIYNSGTLTLTGNLAGAYQLTKEGSGSLVVRGISNTLSGGIVISEGSITVASGSSFGSNNSLIFNQSSGTNPIVTLNNASQTLSGISSTFADVSGTQINTLALGAGHTLTVDQATNTTFGLGAIATLTSIITGTTSTLVKTGAGRLTLNNGGHTFYGGLTVAAGELRFCPASSTTLGNGSNLCPLNMTGGTFSTYTIPAGVVCSLGVLNNIANATIALDTVNTHSIILPSLGVNTGTLTITGWKGSFNGTTGTKGKIFIGSSSILSAAQLAQIQFTDGARIVPAYQLATGEIVPRAPITITMSAYGPFYNDNATVISVSYTTSATYYTGNFKVQLSGASGAFANFTSNIIGTGTSATTGTISATIPALTGTGYYRVRVISTAPYVTASDDNGSDIVIKNAIPIITSVSAHNSTMPGDTITITGSRFDTVLSKNLVYFGPVKARPVSGNTISLRVPVPFGAVLGNISVYDTATKWVGSDNYPYVPAYNNVFFEPGISFAPRVDYQVRLCPNIAAIGDLDGDNFPDLVTVHKISRSITILRNTGTGVAGYDTVATLVCQGNPSNVKIADIDGDGRQDIVVSTGSGGSTIGVFRNITNFNAASPRTITMATRSDIIISGVSTHPGVLGIADFDNDGRLDIAAPCYASSPYKMVVLRNNNNPGTTNLFTVYGFNTGSSSSPSSSLTSSMAIGDYNNDNLPDVAVVTQDAISSGTLSVFKNTSSLPGEISFASPLALSTGVYPLDVASADMDGDGRVDLVTSQTYSNSLSLYRNTYVAPSSTLSFASASVISSSLSSPAGIALGDLDADGKPDIAVANFVASGSVTVFRNTSTSGSPSFVNSGNLTTRSFPAGLSIGDLDLDGYPEIVTGNTGNDTGNTISILRNTPVVAIGTIFPTSPSVCVGSTLTLGYSLSVPAGETGVWTSSNISVASVDAATGVVSGITAGTATITFTATVTNGNLSRYTTRAITVNPLPAVAVSGFRTVCQGGTTTLTGSPSGGSWATATAITTVSASGAVTGVASSGTDIISYSYTSPLCCTNADTHKISIIVAPSPGIISGPDSLCTGSSVIYSTSGDAGGRWITSNDLIVSVDSITANATALNPGLAILTYKFVTGCGTFQTSKLVWARTLPEVPVITGASSVCVGANNTLSSVPADGTWSSGDMAKATVSASGIVYGLTIGAVNISYTVSNACGANTGVAPINVADTPAAPGAITGSDTLCRDGVTTLYNASAGGTWSSANTLIASIDAAGVVYGIAAGSTTISYVLANACGTSAPATFPIVLSEYPVAAIASAIPPCNGYTSNITISGSAGASILYSVDGGSYLSASLSAGSYSFSTGVITGAHTYLLHNVSNAVCTLLVDTSVVITPQTITWVGGAGGAEADWFTAGNWSCGIVPSVTDSILIPTTTYQPYVNANTSVGSIAILTGATVEINDGNYLMVKEKLLNNGTISGGGSVIMNGSAHQKISGIGRINTLEIDNASGVDIAMASLVTIGKELLLTSGLFSTADSLELASYDTTTAARIAPIAPGASISGKVRVCQYVQGGIRRFRFWSHPFSQPLSLAQVQQYIDITGVGGAPNGFTTTSTNAPSAFRHDPYTSDATASYDPGWKPFTKINTSAADSNKLLPGQGIRLFFRGVKGQGLNGYPYVPLPVIVKMQGTVNQGRQVIYLKKGATANQDYNMVGNPYPSPVDIGSVLYGAQQSGNVTGGAFYVWNPSIGYAGQYMAVPIGVSSPIPYYLQANTAFQVRAANDGDSLVFNENNKSAVADNFLLKQQTDFIELNVYDAGGHLWDMLKIRDNALSTSNEDMRYDAVKPVGGDLMFYSLSADGKRLAIDTRQLEHDVHIPLGFTSNVSGKYYINIDRMPGALQDKLYLHDMTNDTYVPLKEGTSIAVAVALNDAVLAAGKKYEIISNISTRSNIFTVLPNPATKEVTVNFTTPVNGNVLVEVFDMLGRKMLAVTPTEGESSFKLDIAKLAAANYLVAININGSASILTLAVTNN